MFDPGYDLQAIEEELGERLARLTPEQQQAVIDDALDLLTAEEQARLLATVARALSKVVQDAWWPGARPPRGGRRAE